VTLNRREGSPVLSVRFVLAVDDGPGLPDTPEMLDAPEAEAGG